MKIKLPRSSYNWISLIGATIASISFFMIVFLFVVSTLFDRGNSYLGLVIYIILPAFLVAGLILIPLGMIREKKLIEKNEAREKRLPLIDLNDERHRNAFVIFGIGTVVFLFISAIGSYEAFHYTESVEFCGTVCHNVMKPEYVAYQNSPHARVACVDCHVGEGVDWYVRSKLSGLEQVYAVMANNYPTPIPTPIKNLRPARETCEQCHWPEKFYAQKLRYQKHFLADEENSEWDIKMVMRLGASHSALGLQEGIHWHINPDVKIEYAATDPQRNAEMPWVKYTNLKTGEVTIYEDADNPLAEGALDTLQVREMDCMDCHNRPSHNYKPPAFFVNNAMTAGTMPKELPELKYISMEICSEEFDSEKEASFYIDSTLTDFYNENYPGTDTALVNQAVKGLQTEFNKNIFPEMKVRWDEYPNHIGHVEFNGCFRCHNDLHASSEGKVISKDCNQCHYITAQGPADSLMLSMEGESLEFKHPTDIGEAWKDFLCTDCHTGLNP